MSSATNPRAPARREHDDCLREVVGGWRVCLTAGQAGLAVAAAASDRIRVVLGEPSTPGEQPRVVRRLELAAARLLWAGLGVADALDALHTLLARRRSPQSGNVFMVVIDLFVTGRVEVAQSGPAVVRHITPGGDRRTTGPLTVIDRLDDKGWIAGMPASFAQPMPPGSLRVYESPTDPCEVRDRLVSRALAGQPSDVRQAPPIVIANRVGSGQARTLLPSGSTLHRRTLG